MRLTIILFTLVFGWSGHSLMAQPARGEKYSASYGFGAMLDHNGRIVVEWVDTTSSAFRLGVKPGQEILGWNRLPVSKHLEKIRVKPFRKTYRGMTDQQIRLLILTRCKPGESAEVFFMTESGSNRGIRVTGK